MSLSSPRGSPGFLSRLDGYVITVTVVLFIQLVVYAIAFDLPWKYTGSVYAGASIGTLVMFLLQILGTIAAGGITSATVVLVAWISGLGMARGVVIAVVAAGLSMFNFTENLDGRNGRYFYISPEESAREEALRQAIGEYERRLEPAFAKQEIEPLQAALAGADPHLTPARLLCMARVYKPELERQPRPEQQQYQRYLDQVAELAWGADSDPEMRLAVGLQAADAALIFGSAADLRRWLERDVPVQDVNWDHQVYPLTEPAGRCWAMEKWPIWAWERTEREPQEKLALLLQHGFRVPPIYAREMYSSGPLSPQILELLAEQGLAPDALLEGGGKMAPLPEAIRMATRIQHLETSRGFWFEDDEIVDYVRALVVAGASPGDANSHDLDAWKTLEKVRGELLRFKDEEAVRRREDKARLEAVKPEDRDKVLSGMRENWYPDRLDLSRGSLMRRIEQALPKPPCRVGTDPWGYRVLIVQPALPCAG